MTNKIRLQIVNLAQSIFSDEEFNKVMYYLDNLKYNDLRLLVDEKLEYIESLNAFESTNVLLAQINFCNELENIVMEVYLETMV